MGLLRRPQSAVASVAATSTACEDETAVKQYFQGTRVRMQFSYVQDGMSPFSMHEDADRNVRYTQYAL